MRLRVKCILYSTVLFFMIFKLRFTWKCHLDIPVRLIWQTTVYVCIQVFVKGLPLTYESFVCLYLFILLNIWIQHHVLCLLFCLFPLYLIEVVCCEPAWAGHLWVYDAWITFVHSYLIRFWDICLWDWSFIFYKIQQQHVFPETLCPLHENSLWTVFIGATFYERNGLY